MVAPLPPTAFLTGGLGAGATTAAVTGGMSPWMAAMGGPLGLALGGAQIGLSLLGGAQKKKAQRQDYANQVAFQDATSEFNAQQASRNAEIQDLNADYKYWADTVQYNNQLAQVQSNRNYEFSKELVEAERVNQARVSAGASYVVNADVIAQQLRERAMQESMALMQQNRRALASSSTARVSLNGGKDLERFERNFAFQKGEYATISAINSNLRDRQYRRDQMGNITKYLNQYNSQQFYQRQTFMDPIAPFAPLPTLVQAPPPSMRGAGPANTALLDTATSVLGGVNTALNFGSNLKKVS